MHYKVMRRALIMIYSATSASYRAELLPRGWYFSKKLLKSQKFVIIRLMDYEFSVGWMLGGLAIALAGGLVVIFYKQISDNLASGVSSYERVKLFGVIAITVGLLMASNILPIILTWLVQLMFKR